MSLLAASLTAGLAPPAAFAPAENATAADNVDAKGIGPRGRVGDPTAWKLIDGKLHLNVNQDVQKKWLEDVPGTNKKCDMNRPSRQRGEAPGAAAGLRAA